MEMHNFNAGPGVIPTSVIEEASEAIKNFNNSGLSILEIAHRSPLFENVIEEAQQLVKELMHLPNNFEVLFLHGGATTQFMQVPMNLLSDDGTAAYIEGGIWGTKAIKEASLFGNQITIASSKDKNFTYIPKKYQIPANASYLHITTNNTVEGTQMHEFPTTSVPLVADMSSDIFSRNINFSSFDVIYAGAQKNTGAAGVNLVVINKNILGKVSRKIPSILDYRNHIEAKSMLNTPPVFAILISLLTLRWIKVEGGITEMEKRNKEKANLLYNTLDTLNIFNPTVNKEDRSLMNAVFTIADKNLENEFLTLCEKENIYGIKGHRIAGGFRASMYNALPLSSVVYLTDLMKYFSNKK